MVDEVELPPKRWVRAGLQVVCKAESLLHGVGLNGYRDSVVATLDTLLVPPTHRSLLATGLYHTDTLSVVTSRTGGEDVATRSEAVTLCIGVTRDCAIMTRANGFTVRVFPLALRVVRLLGAAECQREKLRVAHLHANLDLLKRKCGHYARSNVWVVLAPAHMTLNPYKTAIRMKTCG